MNLLNRRQINFLKFVYRQVQQFFKYITAEFDSFLLIFASERLQHQLLTYILWHFLQPFYQILHQIGLFNFDRSVVAFTTDMFSHKRFNFLTRISIVNVYEFVEVVRLNFVWSFPESVDSVASHYR